MQEFLANNTVNCNLMSLTGYRTLVILDLLMESPKSAEEINNYFSNNPYIKEMFSNDTIRIYINSLREVGCDITRANKSNGNKYELLAHPFDFEIPMNQLSSILKLYNNIYEKIDVKYLSNLKTLFLKIYPLIKDEKTREAIQNISALKNIELKLVNELLHHCENKNQIIFVYNSPNTGEKNIELIADKISFKSKKLYIWGQSLTHEGYSYFRLDRILKISAVKLKRKEKDFPMMKVVYELSNELKKNYSPVKTEKILEQSSDKLLIEEFFGNKFEMLQKILYMSKDCKIIHPESLRNEVIELLKKMEASYN